MDKFFNQYFNLNVKDYFEIEFDFFINQLLLFVFLALAASCVVTNYIEGGVAYALKRLLRMEVHTEDTAKTLRDLGLYDNRSVRYSLARRGGIVARLILVAGERRPTYDEYVAHQKKQSEQKRMKRWGWLISLFKKKKSDSEVDEKSTEATEVNVNDGESIADSTDEETASPEVIAFDGEKTDLENARFYIPEAMCSDAQKYLERRSPTVTKTVISCVLILGFYVALALLMPTIIDVVKALSV